MDLAADFPSTHGLTERLFEPLGVTAAIAQHAQTRRRLRRQPVQPANVTSCLEPIFAWRSAGLFLAYCNAMAVCGNLFCPSKCLTTLMPLPAHPPAHHVGAEPRRAAPRLAHTARAKPQGRLSAPYRCLPTWLVRSCAWWFVCLLICWFASLIHCVLLAGGVAVGLTLRPTAPSMRLLVCCDDCHLGCLFVCVLLLACSLARSLVCLLVLAPFA